MVLVSLCGVSDLFSIMSDYSNRVWLREMMQLMLSACMAMMMLPIEWYVCAQDHCFQYLPS
jgi:hypothetical protein